ncbi:MAG TPA: hypothetical protein VF746_24255 [Longimicrobium sp.]
MKSILLVLGERSYRKPLLDAVAALRAGERADLHVVFLSGPRPAGEADTDGPPAPGEVPAASVGRVPWCEPSAIVERARALGVDLVALAPELPAGGGPLWLDPSVVRVAAEAEQAVLVFRGSESWPPRKVVLPLDGEDAAADTLGRAWGWLDALFGPSEGSADAPPELHVLQAAADMDRWHELRSSLEARAGTLPGTRRVRLTSCMRFGTAPGRRVLRWVDQEAPDLLVLGRTRAPAERRAAWLRVLCGASCPVLLLPFGPARGDPPRRIGGGPVRRRLPRLRPAGGTGELLPSA